VAGAAIGPTLRTRTGSDRAIKIDSCSQLGTCRPYRSLSGEDPRVTPLLLVTSFLGKTVLERSYVVLSDRVAMTNMVAVPLMGFTGVRSRARATACCVWPRTRGRTELSYSWSASLLEANTQSRAISGDDTPSNSQCG